MNKKNNEKFNWKKHIVVFFIALIIFGAGFALSDYLARQRMNKITNLQQELRTDILSLETQFSILSQAPCKNLNESTLTQELYTISQRLTSLGGTVGKDKPSFLRLKKFYSILQMKHWLLLKKAEKECEFNPTFILYFYAGEEDCEKCKDQGYILSYLREKYPFLRIYSFDYNLDLSALETLKSTFSLKKELPIIIINDDAYYGFKNKKELKDLISQYTTLPSKKPATSTTATSTNATSTTTSTSSFSPTSTREGPPAIQP